MDLSILNIITNSVSIEAQNFKKLIANVKRCDLKNKCTFSMNVMSTYKLQNLVIFKDLRTTFLPNILIWIFPSYFPLTENIK